MNILHELWILVKNWSLNVQLTNVVTCVVVMKILNVHYYMNMIIVHWCYVVTCYTVDLWLLHLLGYYAIDAIVWLDVMILCSFIIYVLVILSISLLRLLLYCMFCLIFLFHRWVRLRLGCWSWLFWSHLCVKHLVVAVLSACWVNPCKGSMLPHDGMVVS